jgi:hypothetical protein
MSLIRKHVIASRVSLWMSIAIMFCQVPLVGTAQVALAMRSEAPNRFLAAHGRRAWAGAYSNAGLEVWTGALQIASDVRPEFRRAGDVTAIPGSQLLSQTSVEPAFFTRTYTGPDFSVEERVWAVLDQPVVLIQYEVHSANPVQVIVRFRPSLNLMWPASLGGQTIRWDAAHSAYTLADGIQQFAAAIVASGATAHDLPLNSAHPLPQTDELAVALDTQSPQILFAEIKSARDIATADLPDMNAAMALLHASSWQKEAVAHYQQVLDSQLKINTPDAELNFALTWAEIALDQDWVCNPALGCGFVGGFGPSRRNRRPQYAWFFAGDGMIAARGAIAAGDLEHARDELQFISGYQEGQSGMIWHELTQSSPFINWRGSYPYMYVHADLASPFISTVAAYVRASGDIAFLREIWPSVQKAFAYGRSLVGDEELPQVPAGKEGADEQNPMREELGMSADWVLACDDYAHLAGLMQEAQLSQEAHALAEKARASFSERYWDRQRRFPIQAYSTKGEATFDRGLGAIGAIGGRLFNEEQSGHVLDQVASWRFQTDWGTRSIAMGEPGFNPTDYAHGSVWAMGTADVARAYWQAHRPAIAWQIWRTLIPWSKLDSMGHMDEVLAGDTYHPQLESVPEQTWSSAGFLSTAVHGLFGLDVDAETGTITLAPHLPADWELAEIANVKLKNSKLSFAFQQTIDSLKLHIHNDGDAQQLHYSPAIPMGARNITATIGGRKVPTKMETHAQDQHAQFETSVPHGESEIVVRYRDGVAIVMPTPQPSSGAPSRGIKLTSVALQGNELQLEVDAIPGHENKIQIRTARLVTNTTGGALHQTKIGYELLVDSGASMPNDYVHEKITVNFAR